MTHIINILWHKAKGTFVRKLKTLVSDKFSSKVLSDIVAAIKGGKNNLEFSVLKAKV